MAYSRREFGKHALAGLPAAALLGRGEPLLAQARPNSLIEGVQIGTITYSYRSLQDQSAEATLERPAVEQPPAVVILAPIPLSPLAKFFPQTVQRLGIPFVVLRRSHHTQVLGEAP